MCFNIEFELKYIDNLTLLGCDKTNGVRSGEDFMFHKGLNKEIIVEAAKDLIEQDGLQCPALCF